MKQGIFLVALIAACTVLTVKPGGIPRPKVWHKGAWHTVDLAKWVINSKADADDLKHPIGSVGYVVGDTFVPMTPEEIALSDAKIQEEGAALRARAMRDGTAQYVWHNGAWRPFGYVQDVKDNAYFLEGKGWIVPTPTDWIISAAKKKLWHNGAWRDAVNVYYDTPRSWRSYLLDDNTVVTLTDAEMAASDAKKRLWHNGSWHDRIWKDNMQGYFVDGKFIAMTPEEIAASDAKNQ